MYARIHARMRARMHVYPEIHDGCVKNFSAAEVRLDMGEVLVVVLLHRLYAARMIHRARAHTRTAQGRVDRSADRSCWGPCHQRLCTHAMKVL